jgi:phospholipid transport system substrate-binding protein
LLAGRWLAKSRFDASIGPVAQALEDPMLVRTVIGAALCALLVPGLAQATEKSASVVASVSGAAAASEAAEPRQIVESLHAALIESMKRADELGFDGRYQLIAPVLDDTFDMIVMAKVAIGGAWNELDAEQRASWVALTRRYSAANYADKFDGYSDQHFQTLSEEPSARGTMIVKTELVQPTDKDVRLDYRLRKVKGSWRIIDVQLSGRVSELALRRADYRSVIGAEKDPVRGFEILVAKLGEKIEAMKEDDE